MINKSIMKLFQFVVSLLLVYVYIFAPPFQVLSLGPDKIVFFIAVFYLMYKRKLGNLLFTFKNEYVLLILLFSYSFLRGLLSNEMIYGMYDLLLLIEVITCAYFLFYLINNDYAIRIDKLIILCSILASFISLFLILNQPIALYLKRELYRYSEQLISSFPHRGYGLSDGLFFAYPIVLGFCMSFILMGIYSRQNWSILFLIPMLFAVFMNARSGIVPVFVGLILSLFFCFKSLWKKILVLVISFGFCASILFTFIKKNEMVQTALEWGMTSFSIVYDFLSGKPAENFDVLLGDMLIFPTNGLDWIFGSGEFLFDTKGRSTDIGFLLRLNFGGILYSLILFSLLFYMILRLRARNKLVCYLLFISFIYCHFKGDFLIVHPGSRFFFLIYVLCVLKKTNFRTNILTTQNKKCSS